MSLTTETFKEKAREIHNGKYEYTLAEYKKRHAKVKIQCKVHGIFEQTPNNHLRGHGCPKCKSDKLSQVHASTLSHFIKKAKEIHGDKYNYSKVKYKNRHSKVEICCEIHGYFMQNANDHLNGRGCPECANIARGYVPPDDSTPAFLYLTEMFNDSTNERFLKIGITTTTPKIRANGISPYNVNILSSWQLPLGQAYETEQQLLTEYKSMKYEPIKYFGGHTECLKIEALKSIRDVLT